MRADQENKNQEISAKVRRAHKIGREAFFSRCFPLPPNGSSGIAGCPWTSGIHSMGRQYASEGGSGGREGVHGEGVISSHDAYMIGEFCPKVFALKNPPACRLKVVVVEFGDEASARNVTGTGKSGFFTARRGLLPVRRTPYFYIIFYHLAAGGMQLGIAKSSPWLGLNALSCWSSLGFSPIPAFRAMVTGNN
jgi:hypothetical protein